MCIIFIQTVHALCPSDQCLCVLESVCACAVSVVHDMHVACIVEELLTSDKARLLPLPTGLQCMHCVLPQCVTFAVVVILSSQCDECTQLYLLSPCGS